MLVQHGATDRSVEVLILNADGTKKNDVVFNSAGLALWYRRDGGAQVAITEADLATPALTDAHADGGFLLIGDGVYRLDLPDAAYASGARKVTWGGTVTGGIVEGGMDQLVPWNPDDAMRLGMTALPNAAADAAGGLPVSDAGGLDLDARLDVAVGSRASQTSVDDLPTNAELTTALAAADDATLAAIAALNNLSSAQLTAAIAAGDDAILAVLGAPAGASLAADVAAILAAVQRGEAGTGTLAAIAAGTVTLESGSHGINLDARLLLVLTGGTAAKSKVRQLVYSGAGDVWDVDRDWDADGETIPSGTITYVVYAVPLDKMIEEDSGLPRFTAAALAQAPSGTGASAASIREEMDTNSTQFAAILAAVGDVPTNAELTTALAAADDATLAAIAALNNLSSAQLTAAIAAGDDATLAAIAALNNLSAAQVRTELSTELGRIDAAVSTVATPAQVAAAVAALATAAALELVKAKTDLLPAAPAATGDIPTAIQIADALLARNQQGGSNDAPTVSAALAGGLMIISISSGVMTVRNGDGTTAFTRTLTREALNAIIGSA